MDNLSQMVLAGAAGKKPPLETWTRVTAEAPLGAGSYQEGNLRYVNDRFFSVYNRIQTSINGSSWTTVFTPSSAYVNDIAWSGSAYVGVGYTTSNNSYIVRSTDGINWSVVSPTISSIVFYGVIWDGTRFVAVGCNSGQTSGTVYTSTDGTTWTLQANYTDLIFFKIAYNGTRYVLVGRFLFSGVYYPAIHSGTSLTNITNATSYNRVNFALGMYSIAWSGTEWVAVGEEGSSYGIIYRSTNGTSWANTLGTGGAYGLTSVVYAQGLFVVGATDGVLTSPTGTTWTRRVTVQSSSDQRAAGSSSLFLLTGFSNYSSANGTSWTFQSYASTFRGLSFGSGVYLAGSNSAIKPFRSTDATTWTELAATNTTSLHLIAWNGSLFMGATNQGSIRTSPDGITWTNRTNSFSLTYAVFWTGQVFMVVGSSGQISESNDNGVTWTARTSGTTNQLNSGTRLIGYGGLIVVGNTGTILQSFSESSTSWNSRTSGTTQNLNGVANCNNALPSILAAAVGNNGTILTTTDGSTWTAQTSGTTANLRAVAWTGTQFVVVGDNGTILTSANGTAWAPKTSGTTAILYSVTVGNGFAVASGDRFAILISNA